MLEAYKQSWLKTFKAKGRMGKEQYKKAMIIHIILLLPVFIMVAMEMENIVVYLWTFYFMFAMFPIISSTIQRLHDVGKSGWSLLGYVLLGTILIGWILLGLQLKKDSDQIENKWGIPGDAPAGSDSFVDERLTEQDVKEDRKQLFFVILKIAGISIIIVIVITLLSYLEVMIAPLI